MLTNADVAFYRSNGYLPGRPMLTAAEVASFRGDCERTCGEQWDDGAGGRRRQASNRVRPYLLYPWAAKLVRHPEILDAVERLIGPDILLFHTTLWWKEAHSANFVPWHQDGTYFGLAPFDHITAWVALTPSNPQNGCVRILPCTHTAGQRPHHDGRDPAAMLSRGQFLTETVDETKAVELLMRPGDVSFHHTMAFHCSGPNRSAERRIGFGISYIPAHVRHIGETRLTATLVRGEDRYGHFDLDEPVPETDAGEAECAAHTASIARYWKASESIPEMKLGH